MVSAAAAMGIPVPTSVLIYSQLLGKVASLVEHLRGRNSKYCVAVFVTEHGMDWCPVGGPRYTSLMSDRAHGEIGHYNRRVNPTYLTTDVIDAARTAKLL